MKFLNFDKMVYSVLAQHQYIIINTLVLATCFGFYQTFFRPMFTIGRYIQCAHTLLDPILFI